MFRTREQGFHRRVLDDFPRVHDRDLIDQIGDHAQIVRDQNDRQSEFLAQFA